MSQRIFPITMPKWGIEMTQGTITEWHAQPGQATLADREGGQRIRAAGLQRLGQRFAAELPRTGFGAGGRRGAHSLLVQVRLRAQ